MITAIILLAILVLAIKGIVNSAKRVKLDKAEQAQRDIQDGISVEERKAITQQAANTRAKLQRELREEKLNAPVTCPRCHSTQITAMKKGFGMGKAIVGTVAFGGIGLLAGGIGKNKVELHCMKCGKTFKSK